MFGLYIETLLHGVSDHTEASILPVVVNSQSQRHELQKVRPFVSTSITLTPIR